MYLSCNVRNCMFGHVEPSKDLDHFILLKSDQSLHYPPEEKGDHLKSACEDYDQIARMHRLIRVFFSGRRCPKIQPVVH